MILRSSPPSPFGRKVKIAAHLLGLIDKIEIVPTDTTDPNSPIRMLNPLGKIPALDLGDGRVLYDSRVIVEYLDMLSGGGMLIPTDTDARFEALTGQALADGLMDAALLQIYEVRMRAEGERSARWVELQAGKVARALAALEAAPPPAVPNVFSIATACALGYLDLRFDGAWRKDHPNLVAWLAAFAATTPAFEATRAP